MVKANMLAYRTASKWARDIPKQAFGEDQERIVTAPSAAHLFSMRLLYEEGSLRQHSAQEQQSSKWRSRWEGSDATELARLECQFEDAVGNISTVTTKMKDLRSIKPDGWQGQHAHLALGSGSRACHHTVEHAADVVQPDQPDNGCCEGHKHEASRREVLQALRGLDWSKAAEPANAARPGPAGR
eukprot:jgi/Astpho2/4177/Aster-05144